MWVKAHIYCNPMQYKLIQTTSDRVALPIAVNIESRTLSHYECQLPALILTLPIISVHKSNVSTNMVKKKIEGPKPIVDAETCYKNLE